MPLWGRLETQGLYAKSSSGQLGRISSVASIAFSVTTLHCLVSFIASRIPIKLHSEVVNSSKSRVIIRVVPGVELNAILGGRIRLRTAGHLQVVLPDMVFLGVAP